jgi:hypothetical protein
MHSYGSAQSRLGDGGCGAEGDRTLDLRIANATLSQLSYRPIEGGILASVSSLVSELSRIVRLRIRSAYRKLTDGILLARRLG